MNDKKIGMIGVGDIASSIAKIERESVLGSVENPFVFKNMRDDTVILKDYLTAFSGVSRDLLRQTANVNGLKGSPYGGNAIPPSVPSRNKCKACKFQTILSWHRCRDNAKTYGCLKQGK